MYKTRNLITILGPTASGKTHLATLVAKAIGGEIISADSRQLYQGMDIGTGKDLAEYYVDGIQIPYHLIDIVPAGYKYNLYEYQRDYKTAFNDIYERGAMPILCGGTGLYIEAILNNYQMAKVPLNKQLREDLQSKSLEELRNILSSYKLLHNTTDTATTKRAIRAIEIAEYYNQNNLKPQTTESSIDYIVFGIDIDRDLRRSRITERLSARIKEGMIEEVRALLQSGIEPDDLIYYGLEYKFVTKYLIGEISYEQMFESLKIAIHQFAKRQMTWFRGMAKRGITINWIPFSLSDHDKVERVLSMSQRYFTKNNT